MGEQPYWFWVIAWLAAALTVVWVHWKRHTTSAGLVYAYVLNFLLLHWVAASLYLVPWHKFPNPEAVKKGLEQSTYGMAAFAIGCLLLAPPIVRFFKVAERTGFVQQTSDSLDYAYLALGGLSYAAILLANLGQIPSLTAVVSACQQFLLVGLCLRCRSAWLAGKIDIALVWASVGFVLPFFTIVTSGFLGFGALACFTMLCFLSTMMRQRWQVITAGAVLGYLSLTLFVSYMRDRDDIRRSVWGQHEMTDRVDQVANMLAKLEWFDPREDKQLERIDGRLNQDYLLGLAVERLATQTSFADGETIRDAVLALVPRAIWPDKPVTAGSGRLVSRFTGLTFARGTSVGLGHTMEFYINFGTAGVVFGLMFLGTALGVIDLIAGSKLQSGNKLSFTVWYLAGMSMLNVGGSLVEMTASAGASVLAAWGLNQLVLHNFQRRGRRPGQPDFRQSPSRDLRERAFVRPAK
jgi:hypothetical protein